MYSLYIHIPFCHKKCFYCSFVVSIKQEHRIEQYLDCLEAEARHYKAEKIKTIYIGGGTPTLLNEKQLDRLFKIIYKNFSLLENLEFTCEMNPEGIDKNKLQVLKNAGINRLSLGIQSFNNQYLKYLGRNHSASLAMKTFQQIRKSGFTNVNVDLMFSFPNQSMDDLKRDVEKVLELKSEHISLYALMIEENSRFYVKNIELQRGDIQAQQYQFVCDRLAESGLTQYEVSNFSLAGKTSEHNINYWQSGRYIGLGVGAHSYIGGRRWWNTSKLISYISSLQSGCLPQEGFENISVQGEFKEFVLFGLRMNRGVNIREIEAKLGVSFSLEQSQKIEALVREGFLVWRDEFLRTTSKGRLVLDEICSQII